MLKYQTADRVFNDVMMKRASRAGSAATMVIVEGSQDSVMYRKVLETDPARCRLIPAGGKKNVLEAIEKLRQHSCPGVMGIVDADFWHLEPVSTPIPDVLVTDKHDIETTVLSVGVLNRVLQALGSPCEIQKLNCSVEQMLLASGLPLGTARWITSSRLKTELNDLNFKDIDFDKFINHTTLDIDVNSMLQELQRVNPGKIRNRSNMAKVIGSWLQGKEDPWNVCCGHDLMAILAIGLTHVFGNKKSSNVSADAVFDAMVDAFQSELFTKMELHRSVVAWEGSHLGYVVLPG